MEYMKKKNFIAHLMRIFIFLLVTFFSNESLVFAQDCVKYSKGTGTKNDPYLITTNSELDSIRCNLNSSFLLANDLDLSYDTQNENGLFYNEGKGWIPIGDINYPFKGSFDGNGHKIIGLKINRKTEEYIGLFGYIKGEYLNKSIINKVGLENFLINGYSYVGSVAGYSSYASLEQVYNTGNLYGLQYVGGLIGGTSGTDLNKVYNSGSIKSEAYTGGLVGKVISVNAKNSYNSGNIYGDSSAMGGTGGLFGNFNNISSVDNAINYGVLYGKNDLLMRKGIYEIGKSGMIIGLYNGEVINNINNVYFYNKYGVITNEFGKELTKNDVNKIENYKNFDFNNVWELNEDGYPVLKNIPNPKIDLENQYFKIGNGTEESPYLVSNSKELDYIRHDLTGYYILNNNIDLSYDTQNINGLFYNGGRGWIPIGDSENPFYGVLEGNGYFIKGLNINSNLKSNGLFGYTNGAKIRNINFFKISIESSEICGIVSGVMTKSKINNIILSGDLHCSIVGGLTSSMQENEVNGVVSYVDLRGNEIGGLSAIISNSNVQNFVNYKKIIKTETGKFYYGSVGNRIIKNSIINNTFNFGAGGGVLGYLSENSTFKNALTIKGRKFYSIGWTQNEYDVPYRSIDSTSSIDNIKEYSLDKILNIDNLSSFDLDTVLTLKNILPNLKINSKEKKNIFISSNKVKSYYNQKINFDFQKSFEQIMKDNNENDNLVDYEIVGYPIIKNNTIYDTYSFNDYINSPFTGVNYYTILMYGSKNIVIDNFEFNIEPKITDIEIKSLPNKTRYLLNDKFDPLGLEIFAKYNDNSMKKITEYDMSIPVMKKLGSQSVEVSFGGITKRFEIFVEGIVFEDDIGILKPGEQMNINYSAGFYDPNVSLMWESSNSNVAIVDQNGKVIALKEGKTVITLKSTNGISSTYNLVVSNYKMGDMNQNGKIDLKDIIILIKIYIGSKQQNDLYLTIGDMNNNGKIDLKDIILLLKLYQL